MVFSCYRIQKSKQQAMKTNETTRRNKGGRPRKANKKTQVISMKCTSEQQGIIQDKARMARLSVSEYLVTIALNGKVDKTERALPKEVLSLIGTIHHIAANVNQIARNANR
jgi:hypothetical protein